MAFTIVLGVANALTLGAFAYRPTGGAQFLSLLLCLAVAVVALRWLIGIWGAFRRRRDFMLAGLAAALVGVGGWWVGPLVGNELADRWFMRQHDYLEGVVVQLRTQPDRPFVRMPEDSVPPPLRDRIYAIASRHRPDGTFEVWFFYGYGFPLKRSAYAYYDGPMDRLRPPAGPWSSGRRLMPHWYEVAS